MNQENYRQNNFERRFDGFGGYQPNPLETLHHVSRTILIVFGFIMFSKMMTKRSRQREEEVEAYLRD